MLFSFERLKLRFRVILWVFSLFFTFRIYDKWQKRTWFSGNSTGLKYCPGVFLVAVAFAIDDVRTNPSASTKQGSLLDLPVAVAACSCGFAPPILAHSLGAPFSPSNSFRNHSRRVYKAQGERPRHIPKPSMARAWFCPFGVAVVATRFRRFATSLREKIAGLDKDRFSL